MNHQPNSFSILFSSQTQTDTFTFTQWDYSREQICCMLRFINALSIVSRPKCNLIVNDQRWRLGCALHVSHLYIVTNLRYALCPLTIVVVDVSNSMWIIALWFNHFLFTSIKFKYQTNKTICTTADIGVKQTRLNQRGVSSVSTKV